MVEAVAPAATVSSEVATVSVQPPGTVGAEDSTSTVDEPQLPESWFVTERLKFWVLPAAAGGDWPGETVTVGDLALQP